ncbi:hypothetical protein [Chitinophaga sp. MD30]|nr:hypothetical protein [Chitinophaga sp. MD30]
MKQLVFIPFILYLLPGLTAAYTDGNEYCCYADLTNPFLNILNLIADAGL